MFYSEGFTKLCLAFQKDIVKGEDGELGALLSEKEYLENEIDLLSKNNNALQNSVSAFVEEILEDLHNSNSGKIVFQLALYCQKLFIMACYKLLRIMLSTCPSILPFLFKLRVLGQHYYYPELFSVKFFFMKTNFQTLNQTNIPLLEQSHYARFHLYYS